MRPTAARRALTTAALALVAGAVTMVAACSSDSPSSPGTRSPVGSWAVATVNGKAPPVAIAADSTFTAERVSGNLSHTSYAQYTTIVTTRWTVPGNVST